MQAQTEKKHFIFFRGTEFYGNPPKFDVIGGGLVSMQFGTRSHEYYAVLDLGSITRKEAILRLKRWVSVTSNSFQCVKLFTEDELRTHWLYILEKMLSYSPEGPLGFYKDTYPSSFWKKSSAVKSG